MKEKPIQQTSHRAEKVGPDSTISCLDMQTTGLFRISELKRHAMLRLQSLALEHQQIAALLRVEAEKHDTEAKRLIEDSRSLELYK